ncbi:Nicotinate-nucleotide adenylyltransferase (EC 2.7.7.18) [uncultured Gammaproteobacteria bacterium]|nr:Nicotinate-nucleotide adenylyltransferase (EC 2.7.7.18) [uncultured Gammaproteobacteria bacterium]CAC9580221.1 Nicotinate-nucleotide adenylyltransferase (EC 2.7.7.18) [uncultured Gammaproteobacteria bacterium]
MIGFFGGSFDPIHLGHLNNAQQLVKELNLTELFLMPCHTPVHKNSLTFSTKRRLEMLEVAIQNFPKLNIDSREIDRASNSYTIDSLKEIKREYPNQTICLIMGMDSFNNLSTWRQFEEFNQYCHLIVLARPDEQQQHIVENFSTATDKSELGTQASGLVYFANTDQYDISSSNIRGILFNNATDGKIRAKQNLVGLLPDGVINYLR